MNLKPLFPQYIEAGKIDTAAGTPALLSDADLAGLPELVKNYIVKCGYVGKQRVLNGEVVWKKATHRDSPRKGYTKLRILQFNSAVNLSRTQFTQSGIVQMIEKTERGLGRWRIELIKLIRLLDLEDSGPVGKAALAAFVSEFALFPSFFLIEGVKLEQKGKDSIRASFSLNGLDVSVIFRFGPDGMISSVETDDRLYSEKGQGFKPAKWIASIDAYAERSGISYPSRVTHLWQLDDGDFEYFKGEIEEIRFNV